MKKFKVSLLAFVMAAGIASAFVSNGPAHAAVKINVKDDTYDIYAADNTTLLASSLSAGDVSAFNADNFSNCTGGTTACDRIYISGDQSTEQPGLEVKHSN